MKTIKSILAAVKPSRFTYYNLDKETVSGFKKLYSYLKKHENKEVTYLAMIRAKATLKEQSIDFVRKYKAMEILSQGIKH